MRAFEVLCSCVCFSRSRTRGSQRHKVSARQSPCLLGIEGHTPAFEGRNQFVIVCKRARNSIGVGHVKPRSEMYAPDDISRGLAQKNIWLDDGRERERKWQRRCSNLSKCLSRYDRYFLCSATASD